MQAEQQTDTDCHRDGPQGEWRHSDLGNVSADE